MKKVFGVTVAVITAVVVVAGLAGCSSNQTKPYTKKVNAIRTHGVAITKAKNVETKVTKLAQVEQQYQAYKSKKDKKKQYSEVKAAYRDVIRSGKRQVRVIDANAVVKNTVGKLDNETVDSLNTKATALTKLTTTIKHHEKVVYTHKETTTLVNKLTKQIASTKSDVTRVILDTNNSKKYVEAYNQFTGKGVSVPGTERGDDVNADVMGFYESIGLTKNEYLQIYNGIWDYYGNARNKKWITEQQSANAQSQAMDKLYSGKYARKAISIHKMNFYQIEQGNFQGLVGNWKIVAVGVNHMDGQGFRWGGLPLNEKLQVTRDRISDGQMTLRKDGGQLILDSNGESSEMSVDSDDDLNDGDVESLNSSGFVAINWMINFYPAGVADSDLPSSINQSKERIEVWSSNMQFTEVFERQ